MPSTYESRQYDIHFVFDSRYDDTPKLYAHALYKDESGEWNIDHEEFLDCYYLTEEESQQLARNLGHDDYYDLQIEEWISRTDNRGQRFLPDSVRFWIANLEPYIVQDYSADSREMENA